MARPRSPRLPVTHEDEISNVEDFETINPISPMGQTPSLSPKDISDGMWPGALGMHRPPPTGNAFVGQSGISLSSPLAKLDEEELMAEDL